MKRIFASLLCFFLLPPLVHADVVIPSERVQTALNIRDIDTNEIIGHLAKGESAPYLDSLPYYYIIEMPDGRHGKVAKSWSSHVEGTQSSTIKIASFNIQIFGKTKASKPEVMAELASIVRQYDLIAIQEIKDADQEVPTLFLNEINKQTPDYAFVLSERGGQQADDQGSQEQYAFYYNKETIKALDEGGLFDDSQNDLFQREPFIARFGSAKAGLTFVAITIHTKPEEAIAEIKALHHVVEIAKTTYPNEDDFIVLGDFNAGCEYASQEDFIGSAILTEYTWVIPDDADTNFSPNTACAYDRILITSGMIDDYTGLYGVGTVSDKNVSDHFPVWAGFNVGFHN